MRILLVVAERQGKLHPNGPEEILRNVGESETSPVWPPTEVRCN